MLSGEGGWGGGGVVMGVILFIEASSTAGSQQPAFTRLTMLKSQRFGGLPLNDMGQW